VGFDMGVFINIAQRFLEHKYVNFFLLKFSKITSVRRQGSYDKLIYQIFKYIRPKKRFVNSSKILTIKQQQETLHHLRQDGVCVLDYSLSSEDLLEIVNSIHSIPAYPEDINQEVMIPKDKIPNDYKRYIWKIQDLIKIKPIQKLLSDPALHSIAQEYIGCTPILTEVMAWVITVRNDTNERRGDCIFHSDNDSPKFLKYFIYLHDTNEDSGAHAFIKGTHDYKKRKPFRSGKRYPEERLVNIFGQEKVHVACGKGGTIIAEDTSGFHRGTVPKKRPRLILELQYSNLDILNDWEDVKNIKRIKLDGLDNQTKRIVKNFYY
jgi:hypothetical protein